MRHLDAHNSWKTANRQRKSLPAALLLLACVGLPLSSQAATYYVGDTSDVVDATTDCLNSLNATCSLREAINDLNAAGAGTYTINVPAGTITITGSRANDTNSTGDYDLTSTAAQTVSIIGAGQASTTISGGSVDRIFHITSAAGPVSLALSDLTLTSGVPNTHGGCIYSAGGDISFTSTTVTNCNTNTANANGGAVYINSATSTVTVNNSTFSGNIANSSGGAIYAGYVSMDGNNNFTSNHGTAGSGGAIFASGTTGDSVTINNTGTSTFTGNYSASHGGAIYAANTVTIAGASFGGSVANKNFTTSLGKLGGAVYSAGAAGTNFYTNNTITYNTTTTSGGGIAAASDMVISGNTISNNNGGTGSGGGLYTAGTLTINNTNVINSNTTNAQGGGIYAAGALTINTGANTTVDGNSNSASGGHGGGIFTNSTLTINAGTITTITNNNASGSSSYGGGIYATGAITIDGTTTINGNLTNTSGGAGGGIYAASTLTINAGATTTINNNFAGSSSGGAINAAGLLTINSGTTTIDTNSTSGHGGGIRAGAGGTINNATITNNTSTAGSGIGAGIAYGGDLTVNYSTISNNTASGGTSSGGGLGDGGTSILNINYSTVSGNSAGAGGGISGGNTVNITGSTVSSNNAVRSGFNGGGAVYAPSITTTDSSFTGNSSLFNGGAIYATSGTISVTGSTFTSNTATNHGGALYTNTVAGMTTITNSTFNSNSSSAAGGAALSTGGLSVTSSTFNGNFATTLGGALYNSNSAGNLYGANTFIGNYVTTGSSTNAGGCIYTAQPLTINDAGSVFKNNHGNGSGGCLWVSGALNINGATTFDGNYSTTTAGGGAVIAGGGGSMTDVTFVNNHANDYGGAFFPLAAYTINNSTFEGNYVTASTGGGGALYLKATAYTVTINNSTFSGNYVQSSTGQGGAIFTNTNASVIAYNSTFYNNTASGTIQALRATSGGAIRLYNSIVAHPSANGSLCNSTGSAGNNNVEFNNTGTACTAVSGRITTDPLLSALAYNGGSTKTHALQSTLSSAYDASGTSATASDQRGVLAVGTRDVGAYEFSGVASDTAPPSPVADLATGAITSSSIQLSWTAPGDDYDIGTATTYDVRYATSPITEGTWAAATQATGEPAPSVAGTPETFTVTGLSSSTTYYFAIKTSDEFPNTSPISNVVSAATTAPPANTAPVGGYTADNVIPTAQVVQATDGSGLVTITWKGRDGESDNVTLNTFEYSVDGGATWNAPTNADASASLSANWNNNGGAGWSTATTFAAATAHSFTFNTKHADTAGLNGVDQVDVQVRFTLHDGTVNSAAPATSQNFQVDDLAPTTTIASATYDTATDTMVITGTNFDTIAAVTTDIKTYVDWTKFVWDINGDGATTADVTFVVGDISSLTITNATTLTMVLTGAKGTALEGTAGYGSAGGADTLDVSAGFAKDAFGNAATTDAVANGPIGKVISGTVYTDEGVTTIADGATIRLIINGESVATSATATGTYSFTSLLNAGDAMIVYIDGHASDGTTVTVSDSNALAGLNIYADHLIVRHDNAGSLTNALMNTALGAYVDPEILYTIAAGNLTVTGANTELFVWTGHTFAPGGTIDTVHMDVRGTLDAAANAMNVSGNWNVDAAATFTTSGTVTFDATSGTNTITPGGVDANHDFQNIVFNDAAGTATFQLAGALSVASNLTVTDGIVDTSGSNYAVTVAGNFTQTGGQVNGNASTFTIAGNFEANGTDSGTGFNSASMVFNGVGSTIIYNNLASWWSDGFNNLTVGQAGVTDTLNSWLTVRNMLTVGTGTLTGTATLALTASGVSTTFDAASTLSVANLMFLRFGGSQNIVPLTNGYDCNIAIGGSSSLVVTQTGAITLNAGKHLLVTGDGQPTRALSYDTGGFALNVGGNIVIGAGADTAQKTLNGSNSTITVGGNFTLNDSGTPAAAFTSSNSTVVLNGTGQSVSGSVTFNNLTKSVAAADTLTFEAGKTITANGTLTLNGAAGQLLTLASSTGSSAWNLNIAASGTKSIDYVSVSWSDASSSDASQKPIAPTNSTNGGNTVDWFNATNIVISKASSVISDPINGVTNPKRIPGAVVEYTITVQNTGVASPDVDSIIVTADIHTANEEYDNATGVTFTDGGISSALTLGTVSYSDNSGVTYVYVPAVGYDPAVTNIKFPTTGTFAHSGASFTLKYRVQLK